MVNPPGTHAFFGSNELGPSARWIRVHWSEVNADYFRTAEGVVVREKEISFT